MTAIPDAAVDALLEHVGITDPTDEDRRQATATVQLIAEHLTADLQPVIDEHMQQVAHRVMDVFENTDDDALADDVMSDVFAAIGLSGAFGSPSPTVEAPELLREIFMDPDAKLREDLARVLVSHSTIPSIMPSHLSDCLCGREGLTVTEHAKHVAEELGSSGLVVPVREVERLTGVVQRQEHYIEGLEQRDIAAERDAALARVKRARRWIETCVDPVSVGVEVKQMMFDYLDGLRDLPDDITAAEPSTTLPARLLSGEHVGREVVLPDGTDAEILYLEQHGEHTGVAFVGSELIVAPDDVVTLVDEDPLAPGAKATGIVGTGNMGEPLYRNRPGGPISHGCAPHVPVDGSDS